MLILILFFFSFLFFLLLAFYCSLSPPLKLGVPIIVKCLLLWFLRIYINEIECLRESVNEWGSKLMLNCNVLSFSPFYLGICNQLVKYHQSNTSIQDQKLSCHFLNELFCFESNILLLIPNFVTSQIMHYSILYSL